jgi:predicted DNA-binding protein
MERTPLPPLVSEQMRRLSSRMGNAEAYAIIQGFAADVEAIEADRQRTREVVQAMVNDMQDFVDKVDRGEYAAFKYRIEVAKSEMNIEPTKP